MLDLLLIPVAVFYLLIVILLFIYGINFFYLVFVSWRDRKKTVPIPTIQDWPLVTVQLPIYNEKYVVERLITTAANLDYPPHLLEIQVLDDSTDETRDIARRTVRKFQARGINIAHLPRDERTGFKAGALAAGMADARGEYFAIFDADFIPPRDFLRNTIPHFQNPRTGFIQTRWGHVNRDYSLLTLLQSISIDAHFIVEQYARHQAGFWFNFNGTAGVWRRKAIESAGGWKAETLTEDLDLSYRAFLQGWQACYLRHVEVPAELPVNFNAYRRQQHRWARGSMECALALLPEIWQSRIPRKVKIGATIHLTGYGVHLLLFALTLLYPIMLVLSQRYPSLTALFGLALIFNATALAPTIFFTAAQRQRSQRWWRRLPAILLMSFLGIGMMVNTLRAALQIFLPVKPSFERTPKYGIASKNQDWKQRGYQLKLDPSIIVELGSAALNVTTFIIAIQKENWAIAIYSALFSISLLFTSGLTLGQSLTLAAHQIQRSDHVTVGE